MSNNVIPIGMAKAPVAMRNRLAAGAATNKNYSDGVRDAFPMLSIKGKVFRIRVDGREEPLIDRQTRQVIPFLDVVLANASPLISKAYYNKGFSDDGDFTPPDCWSLDSVRPDPSVANKVSPTCAMCPKNAFGSAPSRDPGEGKRGGKACSDARRLAVLMPGQLGQEQDPMTFLVRVPATSLKSLKGYAQLLERQGWEPAGCVTRLSFDYNEAYPKLVFNFVDGLTDPEYDQVIKIAESPSVASMLAAPDFDTGVPANPTPNVAAEQRVRQEAPMMQSVAPETVPQRQPIVGVPASSLSQPIQSERMPQQAMPTQAMPPQARAPLTQATDPVIELPDGQLFNTATGEFIQRPTPGVEMPSMDPSVIALPDGRFFNQATGAFVVGPEVGAPAVGKGPAAEPPRRTRGPRKPKETPATQQEAAAQQVATAEQQEAPKQEASPVPHANGNGGGPAVQAAEAALDDILKSVLPQR